MLEWIKRQIRLWSAARELAEVIEIHEAKTGKDVVAILYYDPGDVLNAKMLYPIMEQLRRLVDFRLNRMPEYEDVLSRVSLSGDFVNGKDMSIERCNTFAGCFSPGAWHARVEWNKVECNKNARS